MRIITGIAKGTRLETLDGDEITRPTSDMVKEAVFSMLQFDIEGRKVLDLFAGSGQLGLEALSRGAQSALLADLNREAAEIIKKNAQKTKLYEKTRVLNTDYKAVIKGCAGREKFDIIFLDPPYASTYLQDSLDKIIKADLISENGFVVCESNKPEPVSGEGLECLRFNKYGKIYITLLCKQSVQE